MDIKQLEAFVNVIKLKSFSGAAKKLFLTQPTISAHIVSLEQELNTKLLVRTTREVYPTKVGQVLFKYAEEILNMRENAIEAVANFETSMEGEIVISASSIPYHYFLPAVMKAFSVKNPKVTFKVTKNDSATVIKKIEEQTADIGFAGTVFNNSKCVFEPFNEDKLVIIAPNTLYYKTKFSNGYSIQRLLKEPFISRKKGSGTRKESEYLLREAGIDTSKIHIVSELGDNRSVIKAVSEGGGVAVISSLAAESTSLKSKILTFSFENISRTRKIYILKHSLNPLSPIGNEFYTFAQKFYQNYTKFLY